MKKFWKQTMLLATAISPVMVLASCNNNEVKKSSEVIKNKPEDKNKIKEDKKDDTKKVLEQKQDEKKEVKVSNADMNRKILNEMVALKEKYAHTDTINNQYFYENIVDLLMFKIFSMKQEDKKYKTFIYNLIDYLHTNKKAMIVNYSMDETKKYLKDNLYTYFNNFLEFLPKFDYSKAPGFDVIKEHFLNLPENAEYNINKSLNEKYIGSEEVPNYNFSFKNDFKNLLLKYVKLQNNISDSELEKIDSKVFLQDFNNLKSYDEQVKTETQWMAFLRKGGFAKLKSGYAADSQFNKDNIYIRVADYAYENSTYKYKEEKQGQWVMANNDNTIYDFYRGIKNTDILYVFTNTTSQKIEDNREYGTIGNYNGQFMWDHQCKSLTLDRNINLNTLNDKSTLNDLQTQEWLNFKDLKDILEKSKNVKDTNLWL